MHLVLNRYLRFYPVLTVYHREWTLTRPSDRGLYPSCSCDMMIMQQELRFFPTKGKNRHFPQYACFFSFYPCRDLSYLKTYVIIKAYQMKRG